MAVWKIEPSWKKSIIERMYFSKDSNTLVVETGWRWGSFECETEDENIPKIESGTDLWCCDYEVELIETWDGCWEDHDMDDCDEETTEWLEEFLEENSVFDLEEHGWVNHESEMIIDCDPIFERLDGPNAGKRYDSDGDEIPSDDEEVTETTEVKDESIKLQPGAKWPFDNATVNEDDGPAVAWPTERPKEGPQYAQFVCEDCGYSTEDIMDLADSDDESKGAYVCPECGGRVNL